MALRSVRFFLGERDLRILVDGARGSHSQLKREISHGWESHRVRSDCVQSLVLPEVSRFIVRAYVLLNVRYVCEIVPFSSPPS